MIKRPRIYVGLVLSIFCVVACIAAPGEKVLFQGKSEFNSSIKVVENAKGLRTLIFDDNDVRQSTVKLGDPDRLELAYTRVMPVALAVVEKPKRILIVGLGGGSIPNFLHKHYPNTHIDVVDIDPVVVEVAKKYFGFREDKTLRVHVADGRAFIEKCKKPYDIIFLDAYGAEEIPYALATREFLLAVRKAVTAKGVVVTNMMCRSSNSLYDSMISTYVNVFDEVHVVDVRNSGNVILLAMPYKPKLTKYILTRKANKLSRKQKFRFKLGNLVKYGCRQPDETEKSAPILLDKKKKP
ncbi:MAG: fused MFS/spermidine synthase [Phycisphaerales bacterium]|jgi:spermidine synthase|nr:fused MFS/spermidine synthase [Phycisphaerales bacterium]